MRFEEGVVTLGGALELLAGVVLRVSMAGTFTSAARVVRQVTMVSSSRILGLAMHGGSDFLASMIKLLRSMVVMLMACNLVASMLGPVSTRAVIVVLGMLEIAFAMVEIVSEEDIMSAVVAALVSLPGVVWVVGGRIPGWWIQLCQPRLRVLLPLLPFLLHSW